MSTQVQQNEQKVKNNRVSSGKSDTAKFSMPQFRVEVHTQVQTQQQQRNPFWYLEDTPELEGVTSADSNPELGIEKIHLRKIYKPGDKAYENGFLCLLHIDMKSVTLQGIFVRVNQEDGSLWIQFPRASQQENQQQENQQQQQNQRRNTNPYYYIRPSNKFRAQILRYINTLLVKEPVKQS